MHTYIKCRGEELWTVGYYVLDEGTSVWQAAKDFSTERDAAAYVNYLNGGEGHYQGAI